MTTTTDTSATPSAAVAAPAKPRFLARAATIARRELLGYFVSPIAYVSMVLFLLASGFAFMQDFQPGKPAMMRHLLEWMLWFMVFIVPVLCMGLIASERALGTIETLMTAPVTDVDVVVGKYLGGLGFVGVLVAPTILYVIVIAAFATPRLDLGPVISGYLGIIFVGSLFVAVSLFCSSLTRSQVVAAVAAFAILALITIVPWLVASRAALPDFWRSAMNQGVYARYSDFAKGVIDVGHVIFFVVTTAVFLFITIKVMEAQRWK